MKNLKLNIDQFAVFMADRIKEVKNYNFDLFYDIAQIVRDKKENSSEHQKPVFKTMYLMLRDTGSHFLPKEDSSFDYCFRENKTVYEITFCFNPDYFSKESFATINQIK